jgi:primosomal protein N' (replication factor Y)
LRAAANSIPTRADALRFVVDCFDTFAGLILEGVTGSGKTEVYLHAIDACLQRGQQALVLVPEIGLTPQTLRRFRHHLPVPVHVLHSGLNETERVRAWTAMASGEGRVLIGTRSAIFAPLPQGGLIILDEEHDTSYKQQEGWRYHARDVAMVRARNLKIPVLMGSATPSLEALQGVRSGRFSAIHLRQRAIAKHPTRVSKSSMYAAWRCRMDCRCLHCRPLIRHCSAANRHWCSAIVAALRRYFCAMTVDGAASVNAVMRR